MWRHSNLVFRSKGVANQFYFIFLLHFLPTFGIRGTSPPNPPVLPRLHTGSGHGAPRLTFLPLSVGFQEKQRRFQRNHDFKTDIKEVRYISIRYMNSICYPGCIRRAKLSEKFLKCGFNCKITTICTQKISLLFLTQLCIIIHTPDTTVHVAFTLIA